MKVSEIRLHGVTADAADADHCHWCGATLDGDARRRQAEPRYAIDEGRRVLVEVDVWACGDCADRAEPLTDADRADLQRRLDEMTPPRTGRCETCAAEGEVLPHFDHDLGEEFLLCERCFFDVP
jgi:hypothetical protein